MIENLSLESDCILKHLEDKNFGEIVFNTQHQRNIFITMTRELNKIMNLRDKGWKVCGGKSQYIMQSPEAVICDLNEFHINPTKNPTEIFAFNNFLENIEINEFLGKVIKKYDINDFEVGELESCAYPIEKRIFGSDLRVYSLPKLLLKEAKIDTDWNIYYNEAKQQVFTKRKSNLVVKKISEGSDLSKQVFRNIFYKYKNLFGNLETRRLPRQEIFGFWNQYPKEIENFLFILKSSLKYYLGFIEEKGFNSGVKLWEYHLGPNIKQLIIDEPPNLNGEIMLVDRSYTGHTLNEVKSEISKIHNSVEITALFPKTFNALKSSNYFLFLDKLIETKSFDICKKDWGKQLFLEVINKKID